MKTKESDYAEHKKFEVYKYQVEFELRKARKAIARRENLKESSTSSLDWSPTK